MCGMRQKNVELFHFNYWCDSFFSIWIENFLFRIKTPCISLTHAPSAMNSDILSFLLGESEFLHAFIWTCFPIFHNHKIFWTSWNSKAFEDFQIPIIRTLIDEPPFICVQQMRFNIKYIHTYRHTLQILSICNDIDRYYHPMAIIKSKVP